MGYIGRAATNAGSVNYLDDISSGFDGSDTTFTCAIKGTTITPGQENVYIYLDGVFQHPSDAYSISGSTITFTEAPVNGTDFTAYVAGEGAYLDDGTVSTAKLDDDAVTASKLDDDGTGFQVGDLGVGGSLTSGDKLTVTGRLRASGGIIGDLTGNVTGNASGTALTVTQAAQTAITSVGTLTGLTVSGDINFDSNTLFVDASENKVSIGTTSPLTYGGYYPAKLSVDGESFTGSMAVTEYQDGISGGLLAIGHSRGTISSKAKLNQNDIAGRLIFSGFNGADFRTITGEIRSTVTTATGSIADGVMAGNLEFRTNAGASDDATVAMTIDSSQRVGIGTTSPSDYSTSADNLVVKDADHAGITIASPTNKSSNLFFADGTSGSEQYRGFIQYDHGNNATDVMSIGTAGAERLRITSDGELLLKCTSLANDFGDERGQLCISSVNHGSNNNYAVLQLQGHSNSNGVGTGAIYFYDHSNNVAIIQADRASGESSSNLLFYTNNGSSLGLRGKFASGGDFYTNDGSISSLSDKRSKKDIVDLEDGLSIVNQLKPKTFKYNGKTALGSEDNKTRYGFIADDVLEVASQYVSIGTEKIDGVEVDDFKSLSMLRMFPMLVKAVQELSEKVEALENA